MTQSIKAHLSENLFIRKGMCYFIALFFLGLADVKSQTYGGASRVYTDFNGYWTSGVGDISTVLPDNSHHLLGFTWQGNVYSTGIDDGRLSLEGVGFSPQVYQAFPVRNIAAKSSGTFIGLGQLYDGVDNGISAPAPFTVPPNLSAFLTDGLQGLDYGTGVANIASGNVIFDFSGIIDPTQIGDGIPDILVTQFADPSSTLDEVYLTDGDGNLVGNSLSIDHTAINILGRWSADFYDLDGGAGAGFIKTNRDLRLWVAELEAFGINIDNYEEVRSLRYRLNGTSDVAFAAYKVGVFDIVAANNDEGITNQEEPVVLDVLANDLPDEILDPAYLSILDGPDNGSLTINPVTGEIEYLPYAEFFGIDQFTYQICGDGGLQCDEAIVTIEVNQVKLPVKWLEFTGSTLANRGIALAWTTAFEKNTAFFEVETSVDGRDWRVIDRIEAVGFSNNAVDYNHFVRMNGEGRVFVRLRQVDQDHSQAFSEVLAVDFLEEKSKVVRLYPNPVKNELMVEGFIEEGLPMKVIDLTGGEKTHLIQKLEGDGFLIRLDVSLLEKGIYVLVWGKEVLKFQKN
ncbi:Ig-like domain-containing protein [Cyclobacterium plantarum]|uniref:Ig-like domain-containing protein n=1 Tax=Cyclobacterium plantarum TaxID=2716263 RepID=UPI003F6EEADC